MFKDAVRLTSATLPSSRRNAALAIAVGVSFLVCYASVIVSLVQQWSSNDMYAHGFFIPFISGYLLWEKRAALARAAGAPDFVGGPALLGVGLVLLIVGRLGGIVSLEQVSLLITVVGLVALMFGREFLREAAFPLLFLVFMIPVWETVTSRLHTPFQIVSAQIGAALLRTVNIPIHLDGILLYMPNITLEVAQACSGVNFVVAILALAVPQAYLMLRGTALRIGVAIFAVVVALLTNGLRVAVIGLLAYNGASGPDVHGPMHILQGLFVAVVGFVIVFSTIMLLARRAGQRTEQADHAPQQDRGARGSRLRTKAAVLACALLLSTPAVYGLPRTGSVQPVLPLATFPTTFDRTWFSASGDRASVTMRSPGADDELSRTYVGADRRVVQFYVAYFRDQRQGKEAVHERMLPFHDGATRVRLEAPGGAVKEVNAVVRPLRNGGSQYVLFWYDLNGRTITNSYAAKAWTIWDSISRGRTNAALVMIVSDVPPGGDVAVVAADVQAFARLTATAIDSYLPR